MPPPPDGRPATRDGRLAPNHARTMRKPCAGQLFANLSSLLVPPVGARGGRAILNPQVPDCELALFVTEDLFCAVLVGGGCPRKPNSRNSRCLAHMCASSVSTMRGTYSRQEKNPYEAWKRSIAGCVSTSVSLSSGAPT